MRLSNYQSECSSLSDSKVYRVMPLYTLLLTPYRLHLPRLEFPAAEEA